MLEKKEWIINDRSRLDGMDTAHGNLFYCYCQLNFVHVRMGVFQPWGRTPVWHTQVQNYAGRSPIYCTTGERIHLPGVAGNGRQQPVVGNVDQRRIRCPGFHLRIISKASEAEKKNGIWQTKLAVGRDNSGRNGVQRRKGRYRGRAALVIGVPAVNADPTATAG